MDQHIYPRFAALARLIIMTCMMACGIAPAHAQLRSLANPSFELNDPAGPGAPNFEIITNGSVVGWDSTTGEVELWDTNFNSVPSYAGNVHAEMNANVNGTLYQNICLITGESIGWIFAHRARAGGAATQTAIFQVADSGGTVIQSLATQNSTTANQVWNVNTGSTTYTGASGLQRVQFTTSNPGSFGNFLDGIQLTLRPFMQLSVANGSGVESIASANVPGLLITGFLASSTTINMSVTGGTATLGTDYTTPGGGSSFTVTIPAGTYNNTTIPLGINIVNDSALESSETIALALNAGSTYTIGNTTTCGAPVQTTSTYTITDDDSRVTLRKQWANAAVGDDASVTLTRGASVIDTLASNADSINELDTDATPTAAVIGETLTLAETLAGGNVGSYTNAVVCTGAADSNLANGLTIAAGETNIVCTYTNTRVSQQLRVAKTWGANSVAGHTASATTTGGTNAATFSSTASTATNGAFVTVYSGEIITLPAETFGGGASAANYTATLVCTGGTPLASGVVARSITIANNTTATTCTYTNTRPSATMRLRKTWATAIINNAVTVSSTGFTNNGNLNSVANTANETDQSALFTVFAGDTGTIAENFTTGSAANYNATLACTGNANALSGNSLTVNAADTAIVCTYTNTRRTATLTLRKTWVNGIVNNAVNVSTAGFTTNTTLASTANTSNETDTHTALTVLSATTGTISEAFTTGSAANYNASLACTGNATALAGNSLTINGADTAIVCTYTNSRIGQLLNLAKVWAANSFAGHTASATTSGGTNNATFTSTASTNTTGTAVLVFPGEVVTLPAETFGGGATSGHYNATLACTGGTPLASGAVARTITISGSLTATTCTYTNTRRTATLTLRKTWVNAIINNAVTVSTTGLTANGSMNSTANTANETDNGTAFTVYMGDTGIVGESFTTGNASQYNAVLTCTGNNSPLAGSSLTINTSDTAVICTITNTFITPISVAKTSSTLSDGVSGTNPKSIPGAIMRYCILVTNPGTLSATNIVVADGVPATVTYIAGTLRSGANCASATTVEDDNNSGADETDPIGISVSGSTITGITATLTAGSAFAIAFNATVN